MTGEWGAQEPEEGDVWVLKEEMFPSTADTHGLLWQYVREDNRPHLGNYKVFRSVNTNRKLSFLSHELIHIGEYNAQTKDILA